MLNVVVLLKFYKGEISPFDESAIECALEISSASVTLVAMAPLSVKEKLGEFTRLSNVNAVIISDEKYKGSDTLATSKVLAAAVRKMNPELILCGRQSMDGDTAQVPPQVATLLGYNLITNAMDFDLSVIPTRTGNKNVVYPALISVERIRTLRFPSLRSKVKPVEVWDNGVLDLSDEETGILGSKTKVLRVFEKEKNKRKCKFIDKDELGDVIRASLGKPKADLPKLSENAKLDEIFAVGDGVLPLARNLARKVIIVADGSAESISKELREKNAKHVLFEASLKNRTVAPQVSAILNCGLAADCIGIETDGEKMYVYRPASSDSVVAKIGFTDGVEIATVRCVKNNDDLVFSVGYGAKDRISEIREFAVKSGGTLAASRKIVDHNLLGYECQVGLTGKIVSPKVYVAIGISGEVQHIVGFENAETVIAINKDKNAKIFEYADFGVVEDITNVKL